MTTDTKIAVAWAKRHPITTTCVGVVVALVCIGALWGWLSDEDNARAVQSVATLAGAVGAVGLGSATWRVSSSIRRIEEKRTLREEEQHRVILDQAERDAEAHVATMAKLRPSLYFRRHLAESGPHPDGPQKKWSLSIHNRGGERAPEVTVIARRGDEEITSQSGKQEIIPTGGAAYDIELPDDWVVRDGGEVRPAPGVVLVAECSETGARAEWPCDEDAEV